MSLADATKSARQSTLLRSARGVIVALAVLGSGGLLAGCGESGFRPLYGSSLVGAQVSEKLARIDIAPIPGRVGQRIRNELIFQTTGGGGETTDPAYRLEIAMRESISSTLVKIDGDARAQVYNLDAKFKLIRIADRAVVLEGTSYGRAGFERFQSIFSNVRAREDAENRAARTVGEELRGRLSAFLSSGAA